jgi:hypothetical protein
LRRGPVAVPPINEAKDTVWVWDKEVFPRESGVDPVSFCRASSCACLLSAGDSEAVSSDAGRDCEDADAAAVQVSALHIEQRAIGEVCTYRGRACRAD